VCKYLYTVMACEGKNVPPFIYLFIYLFIIN